MRSVDEMLAANATLIDRIKLCYGCDRATFEKDLLAPIRNYAAFVNLLPATSDNFFCQSGGLLRLGLEIAFFALQGTDGHIVSGRATISTRRHLEPRWRQATFLAGLCHELHRTLSQVVVTDEKGEQWPAFLEPLTSWLVARRSRRFFIRWLGNVQETRSLGLFALPHIVSPSTLQYLATDNTIAVPHLLSSLSGSPVYRDQNVLADLVKRSTALVIDQDLTASSHRYGRPILGAHLERYLIDAMRRLVATDDRWAPNQERSRVWLTNEGLFVVWPNAANEIRQVLEQDELPGIPKAPETIAEILLSAGVLSPQPAGPPLWQISPPPGKTVLDAIKLSSPAILLSPDGQALTPLQTSIVASAAPAAPNASPSVAPSSGTAVPVPQSKGQVAQAAPTPAPASTPAPPASGAPGSARALEAGPVVGTTPSGHAFTDDGEILGLATDAPPPPPPSASEPPAPPPGAQQATLFAPSFKLVAPLRLVPQVRDALAAAVDSMNGSAKHAIAITVANGVFIPLEHFKRHQVEVSIALRSIGDCAMAVSDARSRAATTKHDVGGKSELGVVLKPQFVSGLSSRDFNNES